VDIIYTIKMKDLERRISVAPMMDWVNTREIIHWNQRVSEAQIVEVAILCPRNPGVVDQKAQAYPLGARGR
jgi:hypothetical protein